MRIKRGLTTDEQLARSCRQSLIDSASTSAYRLRQRGERVPEGTLAILNGTAPELAALEMPSHLANEATAPCWMIGPTVLTRISA